MEERVLSSVHTIEYINGIKTWATNDSEKQSQLTDTFEDAYLCKDSARAALLAAGLVVQVCIQITCTLDINFSDSCLDVDVSD